MDELNRYRTVTRQRDSGSVTVHHDYFPDQRMIQMTDAKGAVSQTYYDAEGHAVHEVTPTRTFDLTYDDNGNLLGRTAQENGRTYTETFGYDIRDHLTNITDTAGHSTRFLPGLDGRALSLTDREGNTRRFGYTLLGEIAATTNANGVIAEYGYDPNRQLAYVRDAAQNALRNSYDSMGRLTNNTLPDLAQRTYAAFDPLNQPQTETHPRGIGISSTFDVDGAIKTRMISGLGPPRNETYRFDGARRQNLVSDPSGSLEYMYDKLSLDYDALKRPIVRRYTRQSDHRTLVRSPLCLG